jgi:hypothetical protein
VRDLGDWLKPFLDVLGLKMRRTWAPLYVRGLLGPGERKSLQSMALQLGLAGTISCSTLSPAGADAVLVIDDTALPKKGTLSVGVARQHSGQLGKGPNYQTLVSLTLAIGRCRSRSDCGCSCRRSGPTTPRVVPQRAGRTRRSSPARRDCARRGGSPAAGRGAVRHLAGLLSTGPGENATPRSGTATITQPASRPPRDHRAAVRAGRGHHPMSTLPSQGPARA